MERRLENRLTAQSGIWAAMSIADEAFCARQRLHSAAKSTTTAVKNFMSTRRGKRQPHVRQTGLQAYPSEREGKRAETEGDPSLF